MHHSSSIAKLFHKLGWRGQHQHQQHSTSPPTSTTAAAAAPPPPHPGTTQPHSLTPAGPDDMAPSPLHIPANNLVRHHATASSPDCYPSSPAARHTAPLAPASPTAGERQGSASPGPESAQLLLGLPDLPESLAMQVSAVRRGRFSVIEGPEAAVQAVSAAIDEGMLSTDDILGMRSSGGSSDAGSEEGREGHRQGKGLGSPGHGCGMRHVSSW
jgi:hypothetical protein